MAKDKGSKKSKVVLINSFKGGAGKTSISLSLCVSAALNNQNNEFYNKIFYFDIDYLGTGSYYKLFAEEGGEKNFFNYYNKDSWEKVAHKINIAEAEKCLFYAICIDPKLRIKKSNYENTVIKLNDTEDAKFVGNIMDFIGKSSKDVLNPKPNLYILDCSPGLNKVERDLLLKLNSKKEKFDVKEVFVTTYDDSHIQKTVECLKEYWGTNGKQKMSYIILNDIHNITYITKEMENENFKLDFKLGKEGIKNLFNEGENINDYTKKFILYENKYNLKMCCLNIFLNKAGLANSFEDYNISQSNIYNDVINYLNDKNMQGDANGN